LQSRRPDFGGGSLRHGRNERASIADEHPIPRHGRMAVSSHVRQSTVLGNLEGQCRQYDLARAAEAAGFRSMMVIDDNLARSGSCNIESPTLSGFRR
jgi:hypothetical protein